MAVRVEGLPDPHNIVSYGVSEDVTGLDPSKPGGGYGQIQLVARDWPSSSMLSRTDITLIDSVHGRITGTVHGVTPDRTTVSIVADSELGKFNARRVATPFSGPLSGYVQYLMDLAGIYTPLEFEAPDLTIHVPGFVDNVWDRVKQLMSAYQLELVLTADLIVVRPLHHSVISLENSTGISVTVNRQVTSLAIDVLHHNYRPIEQGEVFPVKGEEPPIHTVGAGETVEFDIPINASLTNVYQPVPSTNVGPGDRSGTTGVYTIVGQDNLPIMPAQWLSAGGRLDVYLAREPGVLHCVLTGAHIEHLAPFRIAESAGGEDYNSLHITGDGVAWETSSVRLYTGADPQDAGEEIGATVDNPYISLPSQAMVAGSHTAAAQSGALITIDGSLSHVEEHDQAYGNLVGSRVLYNDAYYRVGTTNYGPGSVSFTGSSATTIADFNEVWAGKTQDEFNAVWDEYDLGQFSLMPLNGPVGTIGADTYGSGLYGRGSYGDGG